MTKEDKKWFDFDKDVSFLIEIPKIKDSINLYDFLINLTTNKNDSREREIAVSYLFSKLVKGWKGLLDVDNKPIKCNNENKRYLIEYSDDITSWFVGIMGDFIKILEEE